MKGTAKKLRLRKHELGELGIIVRSDGSVAESLTVPAFVERDGSFYRHPLLSKLMNIRDEETES